MSRPWVRLAVMCVVFTILLLAPMAGFLALLENYEVLEKGRLLSHTGGTVYKIRFFGAFDLFVEPDHQLDKDTLNAFILVGVAFISLTFGVLLAWLKNRDRGDVVRFNMLMFLGMTWLAADELLGIHETVGHNLMFLAKLPFIERPDDVIILLYAIPAAIFLVRFRKTMLASRPALVLMGVALAFFMVSATSDVFKLPVEQISELLCSGCVIVAVLLLGLTHVRLALEDLWAGHAPAEPSFRVFLPGAAGGNGGQTSEPPSAVVSEALGREALSS
jgi:hypothetical protein